MKKKQRFRLHLYTATRNRKMAHVQLRVEQRGAHEHLYLQWKEGKRPEKIHVAQLAGACCRRRRRSRR